MSQAADALATRVVRWQALHGRNQLPWQLNRDPYRVWLSEIMLQQTQVSTVIGYFQRFLDTFASVQALAAASEDEVMGLWSGLGYYSRARNLHRCAQQLVAQFQGEFPRDAATLQTLPGIGRSTAAAITSVCFGERVAIMDANVKRVLTRYLGYADDLSIARNELRLWQHATDLLPQKKQEMPAYTQGMMDLGAMVCLPKNPKCDLCPLKDDCVALAQGAPYNYPVKTRKLKRTSQSIWLLWMQNAAGDVWLTRRPGRGVWGGLHCFPLFETLDDLTDAMPRQARRQLIELPVVTHVLTHRDLYLHPCRVQSEQGLKISDSSTIGDGRWVAAHEWRSMGLPAPIRKMLEADSTLGSVQSA